MSPHERLQTKSAPLKSGSRSTDMRELKISQEPIELYKLLKLDNRVQSGGEAKTVISDGLVRVNGQVETRKGRKIFSGDVVEFANETVRVVM